MPTFDELVDLNGSVLKEISNKSKNKSTYIGNIKEEIKNE